MSEVEVDNNPANKTTSDGGGFISGFFSIVFFVAIVVSLLWNWDGFWQTNIIPLKTAQKEIFPAKYKEEQLKLSRVIKNNEIIEDIESRLKKHESKLVSAIERANIAKDKAVSKAIEAEEQLASYLDQENLKCRYYDTSLRMINHLTKKYSEDELKRTISCTSQECEEILNSTSLASAVCKNS